MDANLNIPTTGNNESKGDAFGESSSLLDTKVSAKVESVGLRSIHLDCSSRQSQVVEHATSTDDEPFQGGVEVGVDLRVDNTLSNSRGQIFEAAKFGDDGTLSALLTSKPTIFAAIDSNGDTPLHCTVKSACHKGNSHDSFYRSIDLLMNCQQVKLNTPNKEGYTAIGCALNGLHRTCVEHMLRHSSAHRLYLDYYPGDRQYTVRDLITETYSDLQPLLPAPLMEDLESSESDRKLLAALQQDKYDIFSENLDSKNPNPWYDEPYHSYLLEIACQMKDRMQFVKLLLRSGANPNIKNRVTGMPLLHATARSGNFKVLEILLENDKADVSLTDSANRTILHWWARVSEIKRNEKEVLENCFKHLMKKDLTNKMDIDCRDIADNTPLYMAVESGFRDRAKLLLSAGADVMVFEHGSKILVEAVSSIVEETLDDCLESNDKPDTSRDLKVTLNNEVLTKIVPHMAESKHVRNLLIHPVVSAFLILKWKNVRFIFFLDMVFYIMFLFFLTTYILYSESYNTPNDGGVATNTTGPSSSNGSYIMSGINATNSVSQTNGSSVFFLWFALTNLLFLLTVREIHQLYIHRLAYVKSLENWLEIFLFIAAFMSCYPVVESMETKGHFFAIALLLGWFELLLMLGRLPVLSVQLEMLRTVSWTFLKFMMGYVALLIAFTLSFYILFKGSLKEGRNEMFASPFVSILNTVVMFAGEFDASNLSFDTFPFTSHAIFLLFVVMGATVLLNLLNGLAVNDTEEIAKDAETLSLVARAKLISRIEEFVSALPKCMKPRVELREEAFIIFPNRPNKIGSTAVRSLLNVISKKSKPNKESTSTVCEEKWDVFAKKLSALQSQLEKLEEKLDSQLNKILARLDIRECETAPL